MSFRSHIEGMTSHSWSLTPQVFQKVTILQTLLLQLRYLWVGMTEIRQMLQKRRYRLGNNEICFAPYGLRKYGHSSTSMHVCVCVCPRNDCELSWCVFMKLHTQIPTEFEKCILESCCVSHHHSFLTHTHTPIFNVYYIDLPYSLNVPVPPYHPKLITNEVL
jgi:hypothetical protein